MALKVARITAPRRIEFVDTPLPRLEELPGEPILVRLEAGVLCASDFPRFTGHAFGITFPRPLGDSLHECIGQVLESRSPRFQEGDRVLAIPPDQRGLGQFFATDASMAVPLPEYPHRDLLVLGQPLGTVIWAARKLPNLVGADVAVIGQGPIGLLWDQLLANLGARRIIGLDRLDYRLDAARRLRATHTVHVDRENPIDSVRDLTDGRGADLVVEAVGHQHETLELAVDLAAPQGLVLLFGVPHEERYPIPVWNFFRKNLRLVGSVHPDVQRDLSLALDLITQGRIDAASLITHRFDLFDAQRAFELAIDRVDQPIKVLLTADR